MHHQCCFPDATAPAEAAAPGASADAAAADAADAPAGAPSSIDEQAALHQQFAHVANLEAHAYRAQQYPAGFAFPGAQQGFPFPGAQQGFMPQQGFMQHPQQGFMPQPQQGFVPGAW